MSMTVAEMHAYTQEQYGDGSDCGRCARWCEKCGDRHDNDWDMCDACTADYERAYRRRYRAELGEIRVLYRRPDTMELYGIKYRMRQGCGQQPADIVDGNEGRVPYEWMYLGSPGYFGHLGDVEQEEIRRKLEEWGELVPTHPNEWSEV